MRRTRTDRIGNDEPDEIGNDEPDDDLNDFDRESENEEGNPTLSIRHAYTMMMLLEQAMREQREMDDG